MTKAEYAAYEANVRETLDGLKLRNLSATCDEPFFSWRPCEVCKSHLGGDRYTANGFSEEFGVVEFDMVCQDCIYYAEYGRLDDVTMDQIEKGTTTTGDDDA